MDSRISIITLGVKDVQKSFLFYKDILGFLSEKGIEGDIVFFQLKHMILALYPKDLLAKDACIPEDGKGFSGITLAYNVKSKQDVDQIINELKVKGVKITKEPQDVFWGGYHAYFEDLDGYLWEVAWNPYFNVN
jgi:uncharacterized protein